MPSFHPFSQDLHWSKSNSGHLHLTSGDSNNFRHDPTSQEHGIPGHSSSIPWLCYTEVKTRDSSPISRNWRTEDAPSNESRPVDLHSRPLHRTFLVLDVFSEVSWMSAVMMSAFGLISAFNNLKILYFLLLLLLFFLITNACQETKNF